MESYIPISFLNDFVFCPRSIYFHQLYGNLEKRTYQQKPQISGIIVHKTIDTKKYSTKKNVLQGLEIYSEKYGLCGKIDLFNKDSGKLTERKKSIKTIHDGYIFQLYAQYYSMVEMGYEVKSMTIYDISKNKTYNISLPEDYPEMQQKFENTIKALRNFNMDNPNFSQIESKCRGCIYFNLCDYNIC